MKLRWTTTELTASLLQSTDTSLNSHPWRGFDAESVRLRLSGVRHGDVWTITAETIPTVEPMQPFHMYGRIDFNAVVPTSAIEV